MKALIMIMSLVICGCAQQMPLRATVALTDCRLSASKSLNTLLSEATTKLADRQCHYEYQNYHQQLLEAAKGDPSKENRHHFTAFYQTAVDNGVISKQDGRKQFTRFFTTNFSDVLPNDRSTCSLASNKERLFIDLKQAVEDKRVGLLSALGDKDAWFAAGKMYEDLVFVLQTTLIACGSHGQV